MPAQRRHRRRSALPKGNLPVDHGRLVGRRSELAELDRLVATNRLLCLVGPGGIGKTRLALRLGARRAPVEADGVWLIDISPLADAALVPQRVADVLRIHERTGQSWYTTLTDELRDRQLLLILDTCEYQRSACVQLARELLHTCPKLRILATSREALGVADEVVWRVPPLALPRTNDLDELRASPAVQLFLSRAASVSGGFTLTEVNAESVAHICHALDGIPLPIGLAASHIGSLGLGALAQRVQAHLVLALTGRRDAPARQYTLRATLDWDYALLSEQERLLLRRLAVFVGGWSATAAQAVCADDLLAPQAVTDLLNNLEAKSLVLRTISPEVERYRFINTTRLYALGRLVDSGDWEPLARRHLAWCRTFAEKAPVEPLDMSHALLVEREQDNIHAALGWSLAAGDAEAGLRIAVAACPMWFSRGHLAEARTWLDRLLEMAPVASSARAAAVAWRGQLLILNGEFARVEAELQQVFTDQSRVGDAAGAGLASLVLGNLSLWRGDLMRARELFSQTITRLAPMQSPWGDVALVQLGRIASETGDLAATRELAQRIRRIGQARRQPLAIGRSLQLEAVLSAVGGDSSAAIRQLDAATSLQADIGDRIGHVDSLIQRGELMLGVGRSVHAHDAFREAALEIRGSGDRLRLIRAIEGIACSLALDLPETTVRLASAAEDQRARMVALRWPRDQLRLDVALVTARGLLSVDDYSQAWELGQSMLEADVVALAAAEITRPRSTQPGSASVLSPREREVLRLFASGTAAAQIGERLVISHATVRTHLERIMAKLGVHSRVQLARWAAEPENARQLFLDPG